MHVEFARDAPPRYRLLTPLGRGGMAEVFLADDMQLGRQVAVKFLAGELAGDPSARERLQREARAAASLDHPFVCKVFDTGLLDGRPFIAMEYVRGDTLRARIDGGRFGPDRLGDASLRQALLDSPLPRRLRVNGASVPTTDRV